MLERLTDRKYKKFALLLIGAVLTGLTLVFPAIGLLEWVTMIPVGIFLLSQASKDEYRLRSMYGYGFFFFMCFYVVVFHWFVNLYPLDFIEGMTKPAAIAVVLAGSLGLSALQALFGGLVFVLARLIFKTRLMREKQFLRPFVAAGLWAVYEWTQTLGWWGVPWGRLALGQSRYVVGLQTASLFGSYFITFALVCVNFCIAYAILHADKIKLMSICAASVLLFQYGVGTLLYFIPVDSEQTVRVAAIQGNIASNEKWSFDSRDRTFEVYEEYTLRAAEEGAEIVVFPETALPYNIKESNGYGRWCSELARKADVTLLVGGFTDSDTGEELNSLVCVLPDGSFHDTVYSKRRLVPFGEFVPMRKLFETLIPPLAELVMSDDDIAAGEGAQVVALEKVNIGSLICFDSIYENLSRDSVLDGAELICLSTNDSWFTDSAALYMHNAQAQLRAIENGRYVLRAANTGITTVISAKGDVKEQTEPLVEDMVVSDVHVNTHSTLYTLTGNFFVFVAATLLLLVLAFDTANRIKQRKTNNK